MIRRLATLLVLLFSPLTAHAADKLTIVKAGPVGEIANLAEANEIRVVFSEPMVALGKIPKVVGAPFFHLTPAVKGTFRWSGTTTLIFTPDPKMPLPFATKFDVAIDANATSVSGKTLDHAYEFSFVTPTIRLLNTNWYRKGGFDAPVVIALRFNQPVDANTIGPHLQLRTEGHELTEPAIPALERLKRLEPQSVAAFNAKVAAARAAATSNGEAVMSFFPADWDKKRFPPSPDLVVVETKPGVQPDMWLQVFLDDKLAPSVGRVATRRSQSFTVQLEPTLFVDGPWCASACNPERYNRITLRVEAKWESIRDAITVVDITDPTHETPVTREKHTVPDWRSVTNSISLDEMGFSVLPAHTYAIRIDPSLQSDDGQKLGYTWMATIEEWHKSAFVSFGDGHGVWESSGGTVLPFHARNYQNVTQWLMPLSVEQMMPTMLDLEKKGFNRVPPAAPVERKLAPVPDKIQSYGLNLKSALDAHGHGFVWAALRAGQPIPHADNYPGETRSTLVQVTNLGISIKDSPQNMLVLVTRLDDAAPVGGANVSIRTTDNKIFWSGATDIHGIAIAPNTDLRASRKPASEPQEEYENDWNELHELHFVVTAEKDGDIALAASNWNDGLEPWDFSTNFNLMEATPLLRGKIFADRGVYKLGEEVRLKVIVRSDTPTGMQLLPAGTAIDVSVRDSHDAEVDKRTVKLGEWSSAEWTMTVPADGVLGTYRVIGTIHGQRLTTYGDFLVAAYRRPDFRVDVTLNAPSTIAGTKLTGTITGRYLFGSPMSSLPVKWTYSKSPLYDVPAAIRNRFPDDQFAFLGRDFDDKTLKNETISSKEEKLNAKGELKQELDTDLKAGWPWNYTLEGDVTDVSRQHIANRTSFRVDPAPWYIGIKVPRYFTEVANGLDTSIVAAALDGTLSAGLTVSVDLHRIQWNSVRQATGNGFYNWETKRKEIPAGSWKVETQTQPVPLHVPIKEGGEYVLIARASDAHGHTHVVLRARPRLHSVGSIRQQSHRSRSGKEKLSSRRNGADHDQVSVGARHRVADHRTRRRSHLDAVRADIDAADRHRSDHRARDSECLCLRAAAQRPHEGRRRRRKRSRQAGLPPRLRRAAR